MDESGSEDPMAEDDGPGNVPTATPPPPTEPLTADPQAVPTNHQPVPKRPNTRDEWVRVDPDDPREHTLNMMRVPVVKRLHGAGVPAFQRPDQRFADATMSYLGWNLWGRLKVMWHWDNAYNGDVYIYPMKQKY